MFHRFIPIILNMRGKEVASLQKQLGKLGFIIPEHELETSTFGVGTQDALKKLQVKYRLPLSGEFDEATRAVLESAIEVVHSEQPIVEGRVFFDNGLPAQGITLLLYDRGFGGVAALIAKGETDKRGFYALWYKAGDESVNLEIRTVDLDGQEFALSATKFNAAKCEVMNLVVPSYRVQLVPAEYTRLADSVSEVIGDLDKIAEAQESTERRDLSYLSNKTGWDARLLALAATAVKNSKKTGIPKEALYAFYRVGMPTNPILLSRFSNESVMAALKKATEVGIVHFKDDQIDKIKETFTDYARKVRRSLKKQNTLSSINEFLDSSGLDPREKEKFEDIYFSHRREDLWGEMAEAGINQQKIQKLRTQGKLAYLTHNNIKLTNALQQQLETPEDLSLLVDQDLYMKEIWVDYLKNLSGNDEEALENLIPPVYTGKHVEERLSEYADDLARHVRMSYPNRVISRMVDTDNLRLRENHEALKSSVVTFLKNAEALGFELGNQSVNAFVKKHESTVFEGIDPANIETTVENIKSLQRLYQITPSDNAMKVVQELGFESAYEIGAFSKEDFLHYFGDRFASGIEAELVYDKAQQVNAVTYNVFTAAKQMDRAPAVYAVAGTPEKREEEKARLKDSLKPYPTMETLFGELDYCECEHCRSVLSPAAYFVDILRFIDKEGKEKAWQAFLNDWKARHGEEYTTKYKNPYDALIERRPDLPHLQLTCENTNTALPYIDIVNEILEFYVVDGELKETSVYDTATTDTQELLAEPQNMQVQAYEILKNASYPLTLPFNLWVETVRRFLNHFEMPLWKLLMIMRKSDDLYPTGPNLKPYNWSDIFMEYLGLNKQEYERLTRNQFHTEWYKLYGYENDTFAINELTFAKALSRKLGVSYKELVDIIRTGFVNPDLNTLVILSKLGLNIHDVMSYKGVAGVRPFTPEEKAAFEQRLDHLSATFEGFDARAWLNAAWPNQFSKILTLTDSDTDCSFDETKLQYLVGTQVDADIFLKINLFVRLWKRLGWTIEEVDLALQVFLPKNMVPLTLTNIGGAIATALLYMSHLKNLDERLQVGENSRLKLLAFWSLLTAKGKHSLYEQLFLKKSDLKNAPVFDDPLGNYLAKQDDLKDHLPAVQGALNLTADEVELILKDDKQELDKAKLSLENVSMLYRNGLLAKGLRLSVHEVIALKELSGVDPFKKLSDGTVEKLDDDHPFAHTLRFVEIAEKVKKSAFKLEDLDYLLRHRFDPTGKYRLDANKLLVIIKTLAGELRRIRSEHAIPADPFTLSDEVLRQKLAFVLPPDIVDKFLGMWTGTIEYTAERKTLPADRLNPHDFAGEPNIRVVYDEVSGVQRLSYRGVLLREQKEQLIAATPSQVLVDLLNSVQEQAKLFFDTQFHGFAEAKDFDMLFTPILSTLTDEEKEATLRLKRERMARIVIPFIQKKLVRQFLTQFMSTSLNANPSLIEALMTDTNLLVDPSKPSEALLEAFSTIGVTGVDVKYFDADSNLLKEEIHESITTKAKPINTERVVIDGYLEVPTGGAYRFYVQLSKPNAYAELRVAHQADPLVRGVSASDNFELSQVIELKAGIPYAFTLEVFNLSDGDVEMLVQGDHFPKGSISRLNLYSGSAVERIKRAYILLEKIHQLITGLELSEREIRYFVAHAKDFNNLDLSQLPTREQDDSLDRAQLLFWQFLRLADYANLKRELSKGSDDLIALFEHTRRTFPQGTNENQAKTDLLSDVYQRLADLTRRDLKIIKRVAEHLDMKASRWQDSSGELVVEAKAFATEKGIDRLWQALKVIEQLGGTVEDIIRWATPDPDVSIARDLRNAVKARFEPANWLRVAQSIFDRLRQSQRDALTALIIHQKNFSSLEKLYEYFLIDPGMEPVVQTSRLRLAISSVQLFIQRCLLNLEQTVHPSAINAKQWEWLKNYRLSEANKKIFLYPENWLEPEFRDDKSHLFQEMEGKLLQGDVNNELVENALFDYLKNLEELARLEIVTIYMEENPIDPSSNTLHVIARTHNLPYKYFYRRYTHQMWTPWEPIPLEIQGNHITAIVWRERLHLFWVTFLEKPDQSSNQPTSAGDQGNRPFSENNLNSLLSALHQIKPHIQIDVQLHWSEYYQGEWTNAKATAYGEPISVGVGTAFNSSFVFIYATKEYDTENGEERAVRINLGGPSFGTPINQAIRIVSKNSAPEKGTIELLLTDAYRSDSRYLDRRYSHHYGNGSSLEVNFRHRITQEVSNELRPIITEDVTKPIMHPGGFFKLVLCVAPSTINEYDIAGLVDPFFYQDNQYSFLIEPKLQERTFEKWEDWVDPTPDPPPYNDCEDFHDCPPFRDIPVRPRVSYPLDEPILIHSERIESISPLARYRVEPKEDWITHPATVLAYDGALISQGGGLNVDVIALRQGINGEMTPVELRPVGEAGGQSALMNLPSSVVFIPDMAKPGKSPVLTSSFTAQPQTGIVLNLVDSTGVNPQLLESISGAHNLDDEKEMLIIRSLRDLYR